MPTTQNISMTDELAAFVAQQVESGDFSSVSEVYREALRTFRDRVETQKHYREFVSTKLAASKEAYERGEYVSIGSSDELSSFMSSIRSEVESEYA